MTDDRLAAHQRLMTWARGIGKTTHDQMTTEASEQDVEITEEELDLGESSAALGAVFALNELIDSGILGWPDLDAIFTATEEATDATT